MTTTITTISAALASAADIVGQVYRVNSGPYGWGYNEYDDKVRAYRVSAPATYSRAVASRASTIAAHAAVLLTGADASEVSYYASCETGTARERCKALVCRFGNLEAAL